MVHHGIRPDTRYTTMHTGLKHHLAPWPNSQQAKPMYTTSNFPDHHVPNLQMLLLTHRSLLYFQPPTMLPQQPSSCTACHDYICSCHGGQNTPPPLLHHFRLIDLQHCLLPNKAYQHNNQSNLSMGCTILRNPFLVLRCFTIHLVHTVAMILSLSSLPLQP